MRAPASAAARSAVCTTVRWPTRRPSTRSSTAAVAAVGARQGVPVSLPSAAGGGGGVVDSAALGEFAEQVTGPNGVLASAARLILGQLGLDTPVTAPEARPTPSSSTWSRPNSVRTGRVWWLRCSTAARRCCSTTGGPAPARTWRNCGCSRRARSTPTGRAFRNGSRAPDTSSAPRPPGGRARHWRRGATPTPRCTAAPRPVRRTPARVATSTRSRWSPARPRVPSPRRWWPSCWMAARPSSLPRPSSTTTGWRSTARCIATTPGSAPSCGLCPPTWRRTTTSMRWCPGWVASRPKALGRNRFTSRTPRRRRCCSRSRRRGWPAICPTPGRVPRWR